MIAMHILNTQSLAGGRARYHKRDRGRMRHSILAGAPVRQTEPFTDLDRHGVFLRKTTSF